MGSLQAAHMMFWEWDTSHYCLNLECLHADAKGHLVHNLETQVTLKSSSFWLLANKKRLKTFTFWALFFNGFDLNPVEMVQSTCTTSQSDTALSVQEQNLTIPALHSTQSPGVLACFCCALMTERGKMTVWVRETGWKTAGRGIWTLQFLLLLSSPRDLSLLPASKHNGSTLAYYWFGSSIHTYASTPSTSVSNKQISCAPSASCHASSRQRRCRHLLQDGRLTDFLQLFNFQ